MSKGIEFTPTQIKAYEAGATMFLFLISEYDRNRINKGYSIGDSYPIWKGDKDIFVKEEFVQDNMYIDLQDSPLGVLYKDTIGNCMLENEYDWQPASQMTKEQSRYSFSECTDIRIVRVKDYYPDYTALTGLKLFGHNDPDFDLHLWFKAYYNQQSKEQNINRTYEDNDYVFLAEFA